MYPRPGFGLLFVFAFDSVAEPMYLPNPLPSFVTPLARALIRYPVRCMAGLLLGHGLHEILRLPATKSHFFISAVSSVVALQSDHQLHSFLTGSPHPASDYINTIYIAYGSDGFALVVSLLALLGIGARVVRWIGVAGFTVACVAMCMEPVMFGGSVSAALDAPVVTWLGYLWPQLRGVWHHCLLLFLMPWSDTQQQLCRSRSSSSSPTGGASAPQFSSHWDSPFKWPRT